MNLRDLKIDYSYTSLGDKKIKDDFLIPALRCAKNYYRGAGFFSSSVLESIADGITPLVRKGGKIKLLASPRLSENDIEAIKIGYEMRESLIKEFICRDLLDAFDGLSDDNLKIVAELIAEDVLDIRILDVANKQSDFAIFHDKFGIIEDDSGDYVSFVGSSNETESGLVINYEKIRVFKSWEDGSSAFAMEEKDDFYALWNGEKESVITYDFHDAIKAKVVEAIAIREQKTHGLHAAPVKLRDYQEEAVSAWVNNGYRGFYVMATGTGKTWTAIFASKELLKNRNCFIVIAAPYKHLVKQWEEDVRAIYNDATIVLISSEFPDWEEKLTNAIIMQRINKDSKVIAITTIKSFYSDRFDHTISKSDQEKLLIVDEAHRFTKRDASLKEKFNFFLGLSATPFNGKNAKNGYDLMEFFGGQVYDLPIEKALERNCLVKYNYYPIFVNATADEEARFKNLSHKMANCFKNGVLVDKDNLIKYSRARLRIIAMAQEKIDRLQEILGFVQEKDHFIVYCGDGKVYSNCEEEIRHINYVKQSLNNLGYKASQFTASENIDERMNLVKNFDEGMITSLAAIRCLDEGINIPSIEGALILASNDDFREFTQRRGRILRKHDGKVTANIYDVILLPSFDCPGMAAIEFRRYYEYARLADNKNELEEKLVDFLNQYSLTEEDISFNFDLPEEELEDE